jgi:hypothetical protein
MIHTTSKCCSPLMSMASRLTIEHASAGNVTSNCTFNIKKQKSITSWNKQFKPHYITDSQYINNEHSVISYSKAGKDIYVWFHFWRSQNWFQRCKIDFNMFDDSFRVKLILSLELILPEAKKYSLLLGFKCE